MSVIQELEAAIPALTRWEVGKLRGGIDDCLESQRELTGEVKAKLGEYRSHIAAGRSTTCQPERAGGGSRESLIN